MSFNTATLQINKQIPAHRGTFTKADAQDYELLSRRAPRPSGTESAISLVKVTFGAVSI